MFSAPRLASATARRHGIYQLLFALRKRIAKVGGGIAGSCRR
jgi:hypothetical protein